MNQNPPSFLRYSIIFFTLTDLSESGSISKNFSRFSIAFALSALVKKKGDTSNDASPFSLENTLARAS